MPAQFPYLWRSQLADVNIFRATWTYGYLISKMDRFMKCKHFQKCLRIFKLKIVAGILEKDIELFIKCLRPSAVYKCTCRYPEVYHASLNQLITANMYTYMYVY